MWMSASFYRCERVSCPRGAPLHHPKVEIQIFIHGWNEKAERKRKDGSLVSAWVTCSSEDYGWDETANQTSSSGGATSVSKRLNYLELTGFTVKQNDWQDWFNANGWLTSFTGVFVNAQCCLSQWPDWLLGCLTSWQSTRQTNNLQITWSRE